MATTKQEKQTATATRIARDNLRLALSQLESGEFEEAARSANAAAQTLNALATQAYRSAHLAMEAQHAAMTQKSDLMPGQGLLNSVIRGVES
jgi:hypothetical protein